MNSLNNSKFFYPSRFIKKVLPKSFFKGNILNGKLDIKKKTMQALILANSGSKSKLKQSIYKTIEQYKSKADALKEKGVKAFKANALNDEVLLKNRIEHLVVFNEVKNIAKDNKGKQYEWLPSDANEPDPEHQLLYGQIFEVGEGDSEGNMPGERYGCHCGMRFLDNNE